LETLAVYMVIAAARSHVNGEEKVQHRFYIVGLTL
jgi:hypothetical protein